MHIIDDNDLLSLLMSDMDSTESIWRPTAYWKGYARRIQKRLSETGLVTFRSDFEIIKGYGMMQPIEPDPFRDRSRKVLILGAIMKLPLLNRVDRLYRRSLQSEFRRHSDSHAKLEAVLTYALSRSELSGGVLRTAHESDFGFQGARNTDERAPSLNFLRQVAIVGAVQTAMPLRSATSVLEVGGGYGAFSEIFMQAGDQPDRGMVIVDIPPVLYVATQYLKAVFPDKVVDYSTLRDVELITNDLLAGRILMIPPWMIDRIDAHFDVFWNTASFQEMESPIIAKYVDLAARTCAHAAILSLIEGHRPGAGGQSEPIPIESIHREFVTSGFDQLEVPENTQESHLLRTLQPLYELRVYRRH